MTFKDPLPQYDIITTKKETFAGFLSFSKCLSAIECFIGKCLSHDNQIPKI